MIRVVKDGDMVFIAKIRSEQELVSAGLKFRKLNDAERGYFPTLKYYPCTDGGRPYQGSYDAHNP